jgi:hypothetical protein
MVLNKNKSEIATSFRNLLRKADEMALEKKKDDLIDKTKNFYKSDKKINTNKAFQNTISKDRLGIKSIKRIPDIPFKIKDKNKNKEYLEKRKELIIKLSIILNKHIHYWLQKELPKFSKAKLEKHIYNLLVNIKKK